MSGIAGILRRDGLPVSENWVNYLEQSLMQCGGIPHRFEDSIAVQSGDLHVILLGSGTGPGPGPSTGPGTVPSPIVVEGDLAGECASAIWKPETLELELGRRGTGQKPLYWLDLDEAGDGFVFCSNPLPLLRIARELDLPNDFLSKGVQEYLQLGFVPEGGALLLPVCSLPIQISEGEQLQSVSSIECPSSTTTAQDVITLVQIMGMPFADRSLLSTLWQYRESKQLGLPVVDGVGVSSRNSHTVDREASRRIALNAIATHVGVELTITTNETQIKPVTFPLATWFRSPQSNLGQLLGDTLHTQDVFAGLPIEQKDVAMLHDAHMQGENHTEQLFALLTLALWRKQVHAS